MKTQTDIHRSIRLQRSPSRSAALSAAALAALLALLLLAPLASSAGSNRVSVATTFASYTRGDPAQAPGRALHDDESAPSYFREGRWSEIHVRNPRVLAEAGGYELYAYRGRQRQIGFDLGDTGVGRLFPGLVQFRQRQIYLLGPGSVTPRKSRKVVPLFGIASPAVASVELRQRTAPALKVDDVEAGFVLLADPTAEPMKVVAFDARGTVVGESSLAAIDWDAFLEPCEDPKGCPPLATTYPRSATK